MLLKDIILNGASIEIKVADSELLKEVQQILSVHGLYKTEIDGKFGEATRAALEIFKQKHWLEHPATIGRSTALSLLEGIHPSPEQDEIKKPLPDTMLGSKTGHSMELPDGTIVFEHQLIIPNSKLTWGELTKGCCRVPESNQITKNLIKSAKGFAAIRDKYGLPVGVTSGYRPPSVNRAVGGVPNSQHLYGLAMDIFPLDGNFSRLLEVIKSSNVTGVGIAGPSKGFYHVDWRGGERIVFVYA